MDLLSITYTTKRQDPQHADGIDFGKPFVLQLSVLRIITQMLIGLMLFFGVLTLVPRAVFHFRSKALLRGFYFILLAVVALFFSVMAFYFAYGGIREL